MGVCSELALVDGSQGLVPWGRSLAGPLRANFAFGGPACALDPTAPTLVSPPPPGQTPQASPVLEWEPGLNWTSGRILDSMFGGRAEGAHEMALESASQADSYWHMQHCLNRSRLEWSRAQLWPNAGPKSLKFLI